MLVAGEWVGMDEQPEEVGAGMPFDEQVRGSNRSPKGEVQRPRSGGLGQTAGRRRSHGGGG